MKDILALIPARSGSVRIKNKNLKKILGKPLIEYSIDEAKKSKTLHSIFISSDSNTIKKIAKKKNCIFIKRPKKYCTNKSKMIEVIKHAFSFFKKKKINCNLLVLLQPTSPLRTAIDIDRAVRLLLNNNKADSLVSVTKVPHCYLEAFLMIKKKNFLKSYYHVNEKKMNISKKLSLFARNGPSIFITRLKKFKNDSLYDNKILAYEMCKTKSVDINEKNDLELAKILLNKNAE